MVDISDLCYPCKTFLPLPFAILLAISINLNVWLIIWIIELRRKNNESSRVGTG